MIELLFPCPIGLYPLNRKLTKKETSYLKNLEMENNTGNLIGVSGNVLEDNKVKFLKQFIEDSLKEFAKETYDYNTDKVQLSITKSWVNKTKQGEYHHMHAHQNSIIAGVFYFEGNDNDVIEFYDSSNWLGLDRLAVEINNFNWFNSKSWSFPAEVGTLLLFPSKLAHAVPIVKGKKDRYSLSFNTFFKGELGQFKTDTLYIK